MLKLLRSPTLRYSFAVFSVIAATLLRLALNPALGPTNVPYITYFLAVIVTAWACGLWPALVTVVLSAITAAYFFIPPMFSLALTQVEHLLGLVVFLIAGTSIALLSEAMHRARARAESVAQALRESREQFSTTLKSIGDAVIATDKDGLVTFMNAVAQELTGWQLQQARRLPLEEVFRIVNEETRREVESPVSKVFREDRIVGLANHSLLLTKDGREIPIEDSGAPIRDEEGRITGVVLVFHDVTEGRRIEVALRESEERYRAFVKNSSEAIWRCEFEPPVSIDLPEDEMIEQYYKSGYLAECNDVMAKMYGFQSAQEIIGARIDDLLVRSDPANVEFLRAFARSGFRLTDVESHELDREGREKFFLNNLVGIIEDGRLLRAWGTQSDITQRKRAEATLRESEARFRRVVESNLIGVSFSTLSGAITYANDAYLNLLGYTREELQQGKIRWDELTPPEYRHLDERSIEEILTRGVCTPFEKEHIRKDGTRVPVLVGSAILEEGGENCVAFILDLTERKRAEEIRSRLAAIVESSYDAIIGKTLEGIITNWNKSAQRMYGYSAEEVIGRPISLLIPQERAGELTEILGRVRSGEPVSNLETVRVRKDGTRINVSISVSPIKNATGKIIGAATIARDITERIRLFEREQVARAAAERAAFRTARLQAITAALSEALTPAQVASVVLEQVVPALGARAGSVVLLTERGDELEILDAVGLPPNLIDKWRRFPLSQQVPLAVAVSTGELVVLENLEARDKAFPNLVSMHALTGNVALVAIPLIVEGRAVGAMGISFEEAQKFSDEDRAFMLAIARQCAQAITRARLYEAERRSRAEAEVANRTKDEFLATLSHELRTPLTAMLGWTRLLRTSNLDEPTTAHALETVERNARAQAQLIEDLLDVSRIITGKVRLEVHPVELVPVIEAAVDAVRPAAEAKSIHLQTELDALAGAVSGDPARLQQVVWNLVSNAVKFTGRGGRIQVGLERANSQLQITVADTGEGIRPEFLPYVFDRFRQADGSTTRTHGGLGLGLAIVRHLVELHGGTVRAESAGEGLGATFTVTLPLLSVLTKAADDEQASAFDGDEKQAALVLNNLRVLVVDDEHDARELLAIVLEKQGASVRAVASAEEALAAIGTLKPDVLVSDIGMPHDDGYTLMRKVRSLSAEQGGSTPAIAVTAYAGDNAREMTLAAGFQTHLAKPIDPAELLKAIVSLVGKDK
ncbi:MAG: PAS domain S-box protein [Pyrinomonadaceae bacterium]|nr:PAS domain S-box protein [Pyrinomonadaceae bacterium]